MISDKDECPEQALADLLEIAADDEKGVAEADRLLLEYPRDPRLHFLRGSILAGMGRIEEAGRAMGEAVEIAPGFAIARFQLGFLLFTSGDPDSAAEVWAPLLEAPEGDSLALFVRGLAHLARDEFADAAAMLREGIAANRFNPALNADMNRLIAEIEAIPPDSSGEDEPMSLAQLALRQSAARSTRH
ncbi:MAG TPA: tetratricopeptide repeat protein [Allosphingosinicella sp.]